MEAITYPDLRREMQNALEANKPGNSKQVFNNLNSALNLFLSDLGCAADAIVGVELRTSFYKLVTRHLEKMRSQGRSDKTIRDRKSSLKKWRALFILLTKEHSAYLRGQSPLVSAINDALPQGISLETIAKQAGIPLGSFKRWRSGQKPSSRSVPSLRRLEMFLALPAGQLTDFVTTSSLPRTDPSVAAPSIPYRERLKKQRTTPYRLKVATEPFKEQWADLLDYKTTPLLLDLRRSDRGQWTPTALNPKSATTDTQWFALTREHQYVPSAAIAWTHVSAYLGWVAHYSAQPGRRQSLALFTDIDLIGAYLRWYLQRSGGKVNGGHVRFIQFALSLLHPRTGYLPQKTDLRLTLAEDCSPERWLELCNMAFTKLRDQVKVLKKMETKSRDPNGPVASILKLENPMLALQDMLHRIRASRPTPGTMNEAVWGRNLCLMSLIVCSPLRANNLRHLTYRADGTGSLSKKSDGSWELYIPRDHFKNRNGAAADREYRVVLDAGIYRDLEAYLKTYRPMLLKGNNAATDFLFVSRSSGVKNQPWQSLNRQVESLTGKYLMNCAGAGPHVMRHLIATAIVKATGQYSTAALVLHDKEETVRKAYSHLCSEDGHLLYRKLFPEIFKE